MLKNIVYPNLEVGDIVTYSESYDGVGLNWLEREGFVLGEVVEKLGGSNVHVRVLVVDKTTTHASWTVGREMYLSAGRYRKVA
jgi:hypothetical protein